MRRALVAMAVLVWGSAAQTWAACLASPKSPVVDSSGLKMIKSPNAAQRALSADIAGPLLQSSGASVRLNCTLDSNGAPKCNEAPGQEALLDLVTAASTLAGEYLYEPPAQADAQPPACFAITIQLSLGDKVDVQSPSVFTEASNLNYTYKPDIRLLSKYYPKRAADLNMQADVVLNCNILDDYSFYCVDPKVELFGSEVFKKGMAAAFSRAAQLEMAYFQAAPQFKDGSPSKGRWFSNALRFRMAK